MSNYVSVINIPAYDAFNKGLIVELQLTIIPRSVFIINTTGQVATALQNNFRRIIEIMSAMKTSWKCLEATAYALECHHNGFVVKDTKSSSMALSIALMNVHRAINGRPQIPGFSGTGVLRIDGSFDHAHLEKRKYLAAKQKIRSLNKFITPHECNHLFDLEKWVNQY